MVGVVHQRHQRGGECAWIGSSTQTLKLHFKRFFRYRKRMLTGSCFGSEYVAEASEEFGEFSVMVSEFRCSAVGDHISHQLEAQVIQVLQFEWMAPLETKVDPMIVS